MRKQIKLVMCMAAITLSFLYPFSGSCISAQAQNDTDTIMQAEVQAEVQRTEQQAEVQRTEQQEAAALKAGEETADGEKQPKRESEKEPQEQPEDTAQKEIQKLSEKESPKEPQEQPEKTAQEETQKPSERESPKEAENKETEDKTEVQEAIEVTETGRTEEKEDKAGDSENAENESEPQEMTHMSENEEPESKWMFSKVAVQAVDVAGKSVTYGYTGSMQTFKAPAAGSYRLSCYGAPGGGQNRPGDSLPGGRGSVVRGELKLKKGEILYLYVGGSGSGGGRCSHGSPSGNAGGFNGGAASGYDERQLGNHGRYWTHGSGGGATDIRLGGTAVGNQILVAGGGGGANKETSGSSADNNSYNGRRLYGSEEGGGGGYYGGSAHCGGSSYADTARLSGIIYQNGGSSEGRIVIETLALFPELILSAEGGWTKESVLITARAAGQSVSLPSDCFSWEKDAAGGDVWTSQNTLLVSENGTYTCKIRDAAGNESTETIVVSNIDRLLPTLSLVPETKEWTRKAVLLTAQGSDMPKTEKDGCSGLADNPYFWKAPENLTKEEETEAKEVKAAKAAEEAKAPEETEEAKAPEETKVLGSWSAENTIMASQNGEYHCLLRDKAGNEREAVCKVDWIDTTAPVVTIEKQGKWYDGSMEFLICAKDLQPDGTPGCGLAQEAYSFDGNCYGSKNRLTVSQEGSYTVWVRDALGNVREQTVRLLHDKKESSGKNSGGGHSDKSGDSGTGKNTGEKGAEDGALKNPDDTAGGPEEAGELKDILEADIFPVADSPFSGKNTGKRTPEKDSLKKAVADDILGEKSRWENPDKVPAVLKTALQAEAGEQDSGEKEIRAQKPDMDAQKRSRRLLSLSQKVLYSVWLAALLCGLFWLLVCLLLEHVTVFERDEKGRYKKIGRCAIFRKKDYKQINLRTLMREGQEAVKVRFSMAFVLLYKNDKVLLRTYDGVELRNVAKEIEIFSCNSGNHVLT